MFKLQHSNTPILQHSKAHGYVPDVQLILAAMDLSSYVSCTSVQLYVIENQLVRTLRLVFCSAKISK